jgi:hypothetical protein
VVDVDAQDALELSRSSFRTVVAEIWIPSPVSSPAIRR